MATQIKLRRDSAANWALEDPVLAEGEPGFDLTNNILKIGDGTTIWSLLPSIYDLGTNIVPAADNTYDLGSPTNQWRHVYTAGGSIYLDNIKLTNVNGKFVATKVVNPGEENEAEDPEDSDATSDISGNANTGNFTFKADRITNDDDASIVVGGGSPIENVAVDVVDELVPPGGPGGVWRMFFLDADYLNLGTTVEVGDTVTTSWGTPITAAITDIVQDISVGTWALHVDQDITAEFNFGDTVTFNRGLEVVLIPTSKTWTFDNNGSLQIPGGIIGNNDINITVDSDDSSSHTWNFGQTGDLTAPGDITTGTNGGRFIQDCADDTTSMRWINVPQGDNTTQLIRAYTGDPKLNTEVERAQIKLNWDETEDKSGLTIRTFDQTDPNNEVDHDWLFKGDGVLQLPVGGDIVDSDGNSVLGSVDNNIWVQTFETATPATDVPQVAVSVEYDSDGNIIALFSHINPVDDSTYYSVGKYTTTGTRIWTTGFADDFNTDGWGLAVDNEGGFIYIAGDTNADGGEDNATLTKIDGATGLVEWSKIYDFGFSSFSSVVDVTSDGDPVMVGYASNGDDRYVATTKVDQTDGSVIWSRALDGQNDEEAYGMAVGPSGEVVAVGYMESFGVQDAAETLSVDPVSDPQWTTSGSISADGVTADFTFTDGIPTFTNVVDTVGRRTADDVIVTVLGSTIGGVNGVDDMIVKVATLAANDTDNRMLVVKYAANGTIAWQKAVQFDENFDCGGADADIDSQGNIYVCGQYSADDVGPIGQLMSIVKFNSSGVKQWSRRVVGNCGQWSSSIVVGADDHLYLSATTFSGTDGADLDIHLVLAKYEFDGTVAWQRLLDYTPGYSFGTTFFGSDIGGSNLAVKQDYVAVSLGFGSEEDLFGGPGLINAAVAQISATGDIFTVGNWDFKAASFNGTVNSTASDITVVDAGKTDYDNIANISTTAVTLEEDSSDFLIGTLFTAPGGDNSLVNGAYTVTLENTGTVTLPQGGTITEGYVTSNPTIQLTPASPDVASQKLVIKGGGSFTYTDNGIEINYNNNTGIVGDTLTFTIYSTTYADQTLYWWIYPEGAGIATPESGTVVLDGSGQINILIDSDDYEFTLRVSPEDHNYDPASLGVESGLINADAPTLDADHHLHLTTGDLAETSIFLGTDDHNVRTTVNGDVEINTFLYPSGGGGGKWTFDTNGNLTIPGDIRSEGNINIDINLSDSTLRRWQFGEDGALTFPDGTVQTTAGGAGVLVPANGDNVSGVANLVFYAGTDWYNTSKVGINPANGFLTIAGTGGAGGIILLNSGVIDVGSQFGTTLGLTRKIYSEYLGGYGIPNPTYSELVTALAGWTPDTIETVHPVAWSGIPEQTWELTGYFKAPAAGTYTFSSAPDDYCFIVVDGDINPTPEMNAPAVIVLTQGQIVSYRVLYANVAGSGTLTLSWRNTTSQISDTANFTGLLCTTLGKTVDITVNNNKTWEFGENGSTTLPIVPWNYVETTFTSVLVTYGETRLTFTVQPDNSITNMSVAVGAGGYGPDSVNLTIPGTTFPGGTSPANNIVFNVQTFESAGPVYSTTTASIVTYVSGTLPQKYDNIASTGSVGIGAGSNHWTFGEDGSLTLPIGVSIDSSVSALYPKIIADSGKLFSIQGQGASGSAALAWTVDPDAAGQYAAVAVSRAGDSLAKVVLQAQSDSGDAATIKLWKFDETGALTIPGDIRSEGAINIDINLTDSTLRRWRFGEDGLLTFPDATVQTTAHIQGEQIFTVDTGATAYAPTAVDFNLLFVTAAVGYSETDPISVTLPNGVPGQRLVIFNGYNLATLTVNPGPFGRDISGGVIAEFIYSGFDGLWMPLYGTNSPT